MDTWSKPTRRATWLLNQTPFDGCLLVFNAMAIDWRVKASGYKSKNGIGFTIHAITGASREQAHSRTATSDLYVTIRT
jgi:hypothetical protein